ncbi:MAG: T9SS type A sorting domain-containing protein [candidate division KSB1 bacterium]|nr:T9SS type A sorting domain-containing protein [candidate division KSB1 bacterium]MDZ7318200.1 T9SS type A sorting domain-containing protein [candidate division KSB1 bacterium]MDZ7341599.1 T9SS type A sorting domain-containing protein [candidate division KSB1 bacterium]
MTKWTCWFILTLGLMNSASAQIAFEELKAELALGRLTYEQYLVYSAMNIFAPDKIPQPYQLQSADLPLKTGTFIVQEVKANWQRLSPAAQAQLAPYFQRPQLPRSILSPSGRFRIHFETYGAHQVDATDADQNKIPDYIDRAAEYFDHTHATIVNDLGYDSPPPDSAGRGKEFDIYVLALNRTYGITYLEELVPGKTDAYSCYIEIDNDYAGFTTKPLPALMVTTAHEYFHAVQVGYRYRDEDIFFMEMCSTWMEDYLYDEVNDYLLYLNNFFNQINYPFYYTNGSWFEYASCLWNHMVVKKYGPDIIRQIWTAIPRQPALLAIRQVLMGYGTTLNRELADFGLWNYFTGSRADTARYYHEGYLYPEVRVESDNELREENFRLISTMRKMSSIYYRFYDPSSADEIGLVITNFSEPNPNYIIADRDSIQLDLVKVEQIPPGDSTYFRRNHMVGLTNHVGIRLNVADEENWFGRAIVTDINGYPRVIQFFPPFMIDDNASGNYIHAIYPNPLIVGQNQPLFITCVTKDERGGELAIYSADGRPVHRQSFAASGLNYRVFIWDGTNQDGHAASSGIYVAILRTGGHISSKKFAVIKK